MPLVEKLGCDYWTHSHREHDLTSEEETHLLFTRSKPDIVIHLAALCGGIGANRQSPADFWRDNLVMGINILEACRVHNIQKLVMVGTTCAYPKFSNVPFMEESIWDGYPEETNAPYGIAKRCLLEGAKAYRQQYGLDVTTVVPTNLYGPNDNFNPETSHIIPALIRKCDEDAKHLQLWGTGTPTRDFLYVEDCADAILRAVECDDPGPINLGSGREVSIFDTAKIISDMMGAGRWISFDNTKPDGQPRRALDTTKAGQLLGWRATTPLEYGIRKTIDWYLANRETKRQCR
jgi:GDP-L-fucose synthase